MHLRHAIFALCFVCGLAAHAVRGAQAANGPDDATLTYWVSQALREDLRIDPSDIKVTTRNGVVTLTGVVRTLASKQYADLEAQKITGVRGVVDELQVTPSYSFDADVAQHVRRRLGSSASITSYSSAGLGVRVSDGVVTLSGTVNSFAESQQAALLASETRGVKAVVNNLTFSYPKQRSDAEIQHDVDTTLAHDVYLSGRPIRVTVSHGLVTLAGTVGSAYQKQRAGTAARLVWNVDDVDNQLKVVADYEPGVRKKDPSPSDAQLEAAVRSTLNADQRLSPAALSVKVHEGDITLLGTVPSYYQERLAEQDARHVVGSGQVLDQLAVRTAPRADTTLRDDVQFHLNTDSLLGPDTITARVRHGIVTLTGVVHNNPERDHATEVASRVIGVRKVVNQIRVDWGSEDVALQRKLKRRLSVDAETNWVAKDIHIAVDQGKVILSGRVNFQSERDAAGRVVFDTHGVRSVDNRLAVISPEG